MRKMRLFPFIFLAINVIIKSKIRGGKIRSGKEVGKVISEKSR